GAVRALAFAPDGQTLASAGWDGIIRLWHPATGRARAMLRGHTGEINAIAYAPDGRTVASGATDLTLRLWNVAGGREHTALRRPTEDVYALAFSPAGRTLASGTLKGGITLWDTATGRPPEGPGVYHRAGVRSRRPDPRLELLDRVLTPVGCRPRS